MRNLGSRDGRLIRYAERMYDFDNARQECFCVEYRSNPVLIVYMRSGVVEIVRRRYEAARSDLIQRDLINSALAAMDLPWVVLNHRGTWKLQHTSDDDRVQAFAERIKIALSGRQYYLLLRKGYRNNQWHINRLINSEA